MSNTEIILRLAREVISQGWTQHVYARSNGDPCDVDSPDAKSFCLVGAIGRAVGMPANWNQGTPIYEQWIAISETLRSHMPSQYFSITNFNDDPKTLKEDVLALIDRAIAASTANGESK